MIKYCWAPTVSYSFWFQMPKMNIMVINWWFVMLFCNFLTLFFFHTFFIIHFPSSDFPEVVSKLIIMNGPSLKGMARCMNFKQLLKSSYMYFIQVCVYCKKKLSNYNLFNMSFFSNAQWEFCFPYETSINQRIRKDQEWFLADTSV